MTMRERALVYILLSLAIFFVARVSIRLGDIAFELRLMNTTADSVHDDLRSIDQRMQDLVVLGTNGQSKDMPFEFYSEYLLKWIYNRPREIAAPKDRTRTPTQPAHNAPKT